MIEKAIEVGFFMLGKNCDANPFQRFATDFCQVVNLIGGILDAATDRLFDFIRAGAGIKCADLDLIGGNRRECLALEKRCAKQSSCQYANHQEIGSGWMAGEIVDHLTSVVPAASAAMRAPSAASSTGSSNMPSIAGIRSPTTTRSPALRPALMAAKLV